MASGLSFPDSLRAVLAGFAFALVAAFVLAIVLSRLVLAPATVDLLVSSTGVLAAGVAGLWAGRRARQRGLAHGALAGAAFVAAALILGLIALPVLPSWSGIALRLAVGTAAGALGGVIGVNL